MGTLLHIEIPKLLQTSFKILFVLGVTDIPIIKENPIKRFPIFFDNATLFECKTFDGAVKKSKTVFFWDLSLVSSLIYLLSSRSPYGGFVEPQGSEHGGGKEHTLV